MKKSDKIKLSIEALLFSTGRALSDEQLAMLIDEDIKNIKKSLKELKKDYDKRLTSIKIFEENKKWRMLVKDEFIKIVRKVVADTELTKALMETLAVIAYRHPHILQSEIINVRGSGAYDHIKELLKAGFITRTRMNRSYNIKLTDKFFDYFDVNGPKDIRAVFDETTNKETQKRLGDLMVVDIVPETDKEEEIKETIGNLEVVDENPFMDRELGTKPVIDEKEREKENNFLDEIDKKIESISNKNDEYNNDESFKKIIIDESEDKNDSINEIRENDSYEINNDEQNNYYNEEKENITEKKENSNNKNIDDSLDLNDI